MTTRWGCEGHTENACCYACAGPGEGPQWWRKFRDFGMLYHRRLRFVNWPKYVKEVLEKPLVKQRAMA